MSRAGTHAPVEEGGVLLQAASLLLSYPSEQSDDDLALVGTALTELEKTRARGRLERFLRWWAAMDQGAREEVYVATFDLDAGVSLYLTESRPRTSRERGAALLDLRQAYRSAGADVTCEELPDYLPLMLEAAAHAPACRPLLAAQRPALRALKEALEHRHSPFALVLGALLEEVPA